MSMPSAAHAAVLSFPVIDIATTKAASNNIRGSPKAHITALKPRLSAPTTVTACPVTKPPASAQRTSTSLSFDSAAFSVRGRKGRGLPRPREPDAEKGAREGEFDSPINAKKTGAVPLTEEFAPTFWLRSVRVTGSRFTRASPGSCSSCARAGSP